MPLFPECRPYLHVLVAIGQLLMLHAFLYGPTFVEVRNETNVLNLQILVQLLGHVLTVYHKLFTTRCSTRIVLMTSNLSSSRVANLDAIVSNFTILN